jgi:PilZ domain-containing protein
MQVSETIDKGTPAEGSKRAERRRHRRCSSNSLAKAVVLQRSSMFRGEILDISQSGCFVVTKAFLRVELYAEVKVQFKFKNVDYHTPAVVMNIQPGKGVGLEFSFADAQTEEAFLALSEELCPAKSRL